MSVTPSDPATRASRAALPSRPDPRARVDPGEGRGAQPGATPRTRVRSAARRRNGAGNRGRFPSLVAIAALLLGPLFAAPAQAEDASPTPTPTPTLSGEVEAYVSPTGNGILREDRSLSVWATLRNGTASALSGSDVTLQIGTGTITDRAALSAWLGGSAPDAAMKTLATASIDPVDSGQTQGTMVSVPADDPALKGLKPGVHRISATIRGAAQSRTATSVVVVPDPHATSRTPVGLVVPITAGPLSAGLLTADELTALTAPDGDLTAQLNSVAGTSAILAIDPAIPAAIRVLGTSAPETATRWLARLDVLPNERFALQFGDADVAAQLADGRSSLLQPTSLQSYMKPEDFIPDPDATPEPGVPSPADVGATDGLSPSPSPSPTETTGPNEPVYPSLESLQFLGQNTRAAVMWPFTGTADAKSVTALSGRSSGGDSGVTLIPSASTASGATGVAAAHGTAGKADVLVYDSATSTALQAASIEDDPAVRGSSLSAATAYLELAAAKAGSAPLLVAVDRSALRSSLGLSSAVEAVTGAPGTTPATLASLTAAAAKPVTITDGSGDAARVGALGQLLRDERELGDFSSILDDPTLLTGPERATILQLMGGGWLDDATGWTTAIAEHRAATVTTLGAVSVAPTSSINLAGTVATLPFAVRNDLPWPVNLTLITRPDDLRLEVQTVTEVTAHASSTTRAPVPVRARIGNGEVTLDLQLRSPTGVKIGSPQSVDVTVHADWEAIGLTALGIAIGGFLVIGLVRTVLARRRKKTDAAADAAADDAGPSAADDGKSL